MARTSSRFARVRQALRFPWLFLVVASPVAAASPPTLAVNWQGYSLEAPAGYCVESRRGPDFMTRYLRLGGAKGPVLVGVYTGHAPSFEPDCAQPVKRTWTQNGLSFQSVRGADHCAEFLVSDPHDRDRGFLHLWLGPDAKDHSELAERLVDSIRPAPKDAESSEPAACH
jgi:hypothetical protein